MKRDEAKGQRLVALFILGCLLFNYPVLSLFNVAAVSGARQAIISWTSTNPATSRVEFGLTPGLDASIRMLPARNCILDGELHGTVVDLDGEAVRVWDTAGIRRRRSIDTDPRRDKPAAFDGAVDGREHEPCDDVRAQPAAPQFPCGSGSGPARS